jgi:hypothetical protein
VGNYVCVDKNGNETTVVLVDICDDYKVFRMENGDVVLVNNEYIDDNRFLAANAEFESE